MKRILAVCLVFGAVLLGQGKAPVAFDAASLKVADAGAWGPGAQKVKGGPGTGDPGRMSWGRVTLRGLVMKAFDVEDSRIVGPDWIDLIDSGYAVTVAMPSGTTRQQFQLMLQNLLIERFQIRLHHETRIYPGYDLVIAPGGAKLKGSADPDAPEPPPMGKAELGKDGFLILPPGHGFVPFRGPDGNIHATFRNYTMAQFIPILNLLRGGSDHVADNTGLTGVYDFTLEFNPGGPNSGATVVPEAGDNGLSDMFMSLEKQLGLKLVKSKGFPLDTIVIDHAEKIPLEN